MNLDRQNMKKLMVLIAFGIVIFLGLQNVSALKGVLGGIFGILSPFIMGACLAFIMNVPMRAIEKRLFPEGKKSRLSRYKRGLSLLLTLLFVAALIAVVVVLILPEMVRTMQLLIVSVQQTADFLFREIEKLAVKYPQIKDYVMELKLDWGSLTAKVVAFLQNGVGRLLGSTVGIIGGLVNGVMNVFISFVFAIYVLFQKEKLSRQGKQILYAYLPKKAAKKIISVLRLSNKTFSSFLSGQCVEAVILGTMFFVSMLLLRMPYALLVGVLISVTALIPIFGAFIGCVVSFVLILMVNPVQALIFMVLFQVLQQIEGNLIYPHVVGGSVGLPSIWVLAAVTLGGNLMGIAGMLIFIPLCSVGYALFRENVYWNLERKAVPEDCWKSEPKAEEKKQEEAEKVRKNHPSSK